MRVASIPWALSLVGLVVGNTADPASGPAHRYAAPLHVECMDQTSETAAEPSWIPFPTCAETNHPLEFHYGVEGPQNCTMTLTAPLHALLSSHLSSSTPLPCRLPSRPRPQHDIINDAPHAQEYIPLALALEGEVEEADLVVAPRVNVLLHTAPKKRIRAHDTGVLDSGVAYSTSPLRETTRVAVGEQLELRFSVRWFPNPDLPSTDGGVQWAGMGGHIYISTVMYILLSFVAGAVSAGAWFYGRVLPGRLRGRGMGGATPLGGVAVGNGWGYAKRKD